MPSETAVVILIQEALKACQEVNAPLLYSASFKVPFSTLKYAMTLDGMLVSYPSLSGIIKNTI